MTLVDKLWYKVARTIVKAGRFPIPIAGAFIEILKILLMEDQAKFLLIFKKPSLNIDQIKEKTDLEDDALEKMLNDLMNNGIIIGTKSRSRNIRVYRLLQPFPGIMEYSLMRGQATDREKKLAKLWDKLWDDMRLGLQKNYEYVIEQYKKIPPIDRVIPIEEEVEVPQEVIVPYEEVSKYIDFYDDIALTNCYCRHEKDLLNDLCKLNAPKKNCVLFSKSAQFAIKHKFGTPISKKDAKEIFKETEDYGLVHKVFHVHADPKKDVDVICNCCKCCCGNFQMYYRGALPFSTLTSYIAKLNKDDCLGCGICVEKCPMETIVIFDGIASINQEKCIGCGVCAHHCPEGAIKLERTGPRHVFVPTSRIKQN